MVNRKLLFSVFLNLGGFCGRNLGQISLERCATSFCGELESSFVFILTGMQNRSSPNEQAFQIYFFTSYMINSEQNQGAFL